MSAQSATPISYNPTTGEPFLRLPSPHENIILTPPRMTDVAAVTAIMHDPKVYTRLEGPPYPYNESHAVGWLTAIVKECADALRELRDAEAAQPPKLVRSCPVRYIREVQEDGTDVLLGDIEFRSACTFPDVQDQDERAKRAQANAARDFGDPERAWCVGNMLASSHHGRGIMSAVLATLLKEWVIPRMGVRNIRVEAMVGNVGSVRVFEKNGFVLEDTVEWAKVTKCGVPVTGYNILRWKAS